MSEYKRLTYRDENGTARRKKSSTSSYIGTIYEEEKVLNQEILNKLAELEDKIESGEIIFINKPFYSEDHHCWGVYQRDGDIVQTCFMTEQQAKEYAD